jgi:hypothetical protein
MRRSFAIAATLAIAATACSTQSPSEVRAAEVYNTAIRSLADEHADDPEPLPVFIEPRGEGAAIALDVQGEVVAGTADVADVVFIDVRDEALTISDTGTTVVRNDGVLLRLGPVVEDGERVTLQVDRWTAGDTFTTFLFTLRRVGDSWELSTEPTPAGTLVLDE